jgi:putative tricarboxylic transport membrane protein
MEIEVLSNLANGFAVALRPENLLFSLAGAFLGTVVGVLPGIGPSGAIAIILPIIFIVGDPTSTIIMLAATYAGAMYGGSTTSILLNVPGESASVVACLDGHQMALKGRAGPALCIAAIGSYLAGTLGIVGLMFLGPWLADFALRFGPPEYCALFIFGLSAVAALSGKSLVKGLMAMTIGLALSTVGTDITGVERFVFGSEYLVDGIELLAIPIGLFAVSEVLINAKEVRAKVVREVIKHRIFISFKEILESLGAIFRGAFAGFFVGVLPGAGASIASFISYSIETQISRHPERFGTGEIKGLAGPESANNAASSGALVPMLSLGVPGSGSTAVMLLALMAMDVNPGPLMFQKHPEVVWGLIAALYLGNIMLLILNLPLVGIFVRILYIPMRILLPAICIIGVIGIYSKNHAQVDLLIMCALGLIGFFMRQNGYPLAPVILGFVLGQRLEEALRQTLIQYQYDPWALLEKHIAIFFLVLTTLSLLLPTIMRRFFQTEIESEEV